MLGEKDGDLESHEEVVHAQQHILDDKEAELDARDDELKMREQRLETLMQIEEKRFAERKQEFNKSQADLEDDIKQHKVLSMRGVVLYAALGVCTIHRIIVCYPGGLSTY